MRLRLLNKTNLIILLTVAMVSCKKINLVPLNTYSDGNFWQVNANAFSALSQCYAYQISGGYASDATTFPASSPAQEYFYNEALSDNAYTVLDVNVGTPTTIAAGLTQGFNSQINRVKYEWGSLYAQIRSCNLFLENVDQNKSLGAPLIARMKAEARYLRAVAFFRLTNFYGDVPLVTTVLTIDQSKAIPRTPKAAVITFILSELDAAAAVLPTRDVQAAADRGRATVGAAKGMKARVLLYQGRWAECQAVCEDLMNPANQATNGTYALLPNYNDVFLSTNKYNAEVMSDLEYVPVNRTFQDWNGFGPPNIGATATSGGNSGNNNAPTEDLVESFLTINGQGITEAGSGYDENNPYVNRDPRLTYNVVYDGYQWTAGAQVPNTVTVIHIKPGSAPPPPPGGKPDPNLYTPSATQTGYYWRKYYDAASINNNTSSNNLIIQRWADVLLMEAESTAMQGTMNATIWNKTVGALRLRAGFPAGGAAVTYPGNTTMTMIDQVRNERRSETPLEELRIYDIKRWRIAGVVLNQPNGVRGAKFAANNTAYITTGVRQFQDFEYLWPVPSSDIQTDPALTQNPGWN